MEEAQNHISDTFCEIASNDEGSVKTYKPFTGLSFLRFLTDKRVKQGLCFFLDALLSSH